MQCICSNNCQYRYCEILTAPPDLLSCSFKSLYPSNLHRPSPPPRLALASLFSKGTAGQQGGGWKLVVAHHALGKIDLISHVIGSLFPTGYRRFSQQLLFIHQGASNCSSNSRKAAAVNLWFYSGAGNCFRLHFRAPFFPPANFRAEIPPANLNLPLRFPLRALIESAC